MVRARSIVIAICISLGACGSDAAVPGITPAAPPNQFTAKPIGVQPTNQPTNVPTPAQEPTMDGSEPTRENPAPNAPTPVAPQAQPQPTAEALDPAMARLVAGAQADLARRRGIALDAIEIVEARSTTWPDPSLGCPQPGMAYRQVPVDGVLIRLKAEGMIFSYHGGGGREPFLCEQPTP